MFPIRMGGFVNQESTLVEILRRFFVVSLQSLGTLPKHPRYLESFSEFRLIFAASGSCGEAKGPLPADAKKRNEAHRPC